MNVTLLYAGLLTLLLLALSYRVVYQRRRLAVGLGDGGKPELMRAVRVHGNFVEYVPLALILMALLEIDGLATVWLHLAGTVLLAARLLHAFGLTRTAGVSFGRFIGTLGTWILLLMLAAVAIARALSG